MPSRLPHLLFLVAVLAAAGCSIPPPTPRLAPTSAAGTTQTTTAAPARQATLPRNAPGPTRTARPRPTLVPFDRSKLGQIEHDVTYCTIEGTPLKMDVYYPHPEAAQKGAAPESGSTKPAPVALYVHGGAWMSGDKTANEGSQDIPELVSRGYLVVSANYRLAPQWKFPAQIEDVKCAVRYLRAHAAEYNLNPDHIGAWGASAGGHLVALLGLTDASAGFDALGGYTDQSSRVHAIVDLYGPTDMTAEFKGADARIDDLVFGARSKQDHRLVSASPVTYVSRTAPPFLIVHGEKDDLVPPSQSEELYNRLRAAGTPVRLVLVKNAGHVLVSVGGKPISPTRQEITGLIADFFDQYLK